MRLNTVDPRCAEIARQLQRLGSEDKAMYWASRGISLEEAALVVMGAINRQGAEILEQGGFALGSDWYFCRERRSSLVVLKAVLGEAA